MERVERYRFDVRFEGRPYGPLRVDESSPPGDDTAPNPSRLLATAVGHCLSSSLLFCLERAHAPIAGMTTTVVTQLARNERGRWRVVGLRVDLDPGPLDDANAAAFERCRGLFEEFCIVTESVRQGIPVAVSVAGAPVSSTGTAPATPP